jgi:osmotically-inducible protein OsmY
MTKASTTQLGTPTEEIKRGLIIEQLFWDPRIDDTNIEVTVDDGKATLTGTVPDLRARVAATDAAWSVWGINSVENKLRIAPIQTMEDSIIKRRVQSALEADSLLNAGDIKVSVDKGTVTLRGTVDAYWKKRQAEWHAEAVPHVVEVTNELAIVPTKRFTDEEVAKDIMAALERNAFVNAEAVNVSVSYGKVTLTGTVPSWTAKRAARDAAWYTLGVIDVEDRLLVDYALAAA